MTKLPSLKAVQIIKVLEKRGFKLSRQSGGHKIYKDNRGKRVTVPFHSGKILHPKVLKSILKDAEISENDLKQYL